MDGGAGRPAGRRPDETSGAMSEELRRLTAERLRTLGKEKAIALVEALAVRGEASVQDLADKIGVSHQNASHHLSLLRRAGVVDRRVDGPTSVYSLEDWGAWWVVQQLAGVVGEGRGEGRT
jgi:DNA-binding transcriptional ArsR family regulator